MLPCIYLKEIANWIIFQALRFMQGSQSELPYWFHTFSMGYNAPGRPVSSFSFIFFYYYLKSISIGWCLLLYVNFICSSLMGNSLSGLFPTVLTNITTLKNLYVGISLLFFSLSYSMYVIAKVRCWQFYSDCSWSSLLNIVEL